MFQAGRSPALPGESAHAPGVVRVARRYGRIHPIQTDEDRLQ